MSLLCLFVLGSIVVAGLWPFHVPRNAVSWPRDENGLRFTGHGSAVSASVFRTNRPPNDRGCSLEILLRPGRITGGGSILAFDSSPDPQVPFSVRQYGTGLAVQPYLVDEHGKVTQQWFKVDHVFDASKHVFLTITSSKDGIALYVNGVLAGRSLDSEILSRELTGRLVLANSTVDDSWRGEIIGLAIYNRELTPAQVSRHFQSWTPDQGPLPTGEQSLIALYLFNERGGNIVHNRVDPATDLTLPAKYFVLHPALLRSTWNQYSHTRDVWKGWNFWEDLIVNIGGFVPVGLVFSVYFSSVRYIGRPALVVILLGLFLSFSIEALQRLLPNRDSGMTDLLTNTTGTALGVLLYRSSSVRGLWTKALEYVVPSSKTKLRVTGESIRPTSDEKL
jgi:VanZ family protein